MFRFRTSRVMPLAAMLAMVVELCVVAFHHHEVLGTEGRAHGHGVHAALAVTDKAGHAHHDHHASHDLGHDHGALDDTHHGPEDDSDHDCDSCILKSAVSGQLMPVGVATLLAPVLTGKRQLAASKETPRLKIALRYHARAPPSQAAIS